jgi:diguanylate cyclase (GGDEF)-like protein
MVAEGRDAGVSLCLLALDVDRLKLLNDAHGHLAGADAVRAVGDVLHRSVPDTGIACRYGGDEFVVALPRGLAQDACAIADDIRRRVHDCAPVLDGIPFPPRSLSVSIGVAAHRFDDQVMPDGEGALGDVMFRAADRALYQAKALGRNHVIVGPPLDAVTQTPAVEGPEHRRDSRSAPIGSL